jgi:hypothetical protein
LFSDDTFNQYGFHRPAAKKGESTCFGTDIGGFDEELEVASIRAAPPARQSANHNYCAASVFKYISDWSKDSAVRRRTRLVLDLW